MKILLIHNKYSKFSGEEAVVEAQIKLLKEYGHEVITYFRSSEEIEKINFGKYKVFCYALYNPRSVRDIAELIKLKQPDIVHIHNLYPLISPSILPMIKKLGIPIVMTVHNYRLICPNGLFFSNGKICEKCTGKGKELNCITNNCEDSILKSTGYALRNFWARTKNYYKDNVDSYLCLTEFQKNKLAENNYPVEKCHILPNFYDTTLEELGYDIKNRNYIAFAGRISPEKGIPLLLQAARNLPEIKFKLAGGIRTGYEKELKIPNNVTLTGMLNSAELSAFYSNARFFVLSSIWYEGFPMVFPEAMTHKLPIIAPNMAGYPEVVEHGINGFLFNPSNVNSLTRAINKLWNNHKLSIKMAQNNFSKAKSNYSSKAYYYGLIKAYESLLF